MKIKLLVLSLWLITFDNVWGAEQSYTPFSQENPSQAEVDAAIHTAFIELHRNLEKCIQVYPSDDSIVEIGIPACINIRGTALGFIVTLRNENGNFRIGGAEQVKLKVRECATFPAVNQVIEYCNARVGGAISLTSALLPALLGEVPAELSKR